MDILCLTPSVTTYGTSGTSPLTPPLSLGDVIQKIDSLLSLLTPLRSTFDASESKLRLECMYGLRVRKFDPENVALPLHNV